MITGASGFVGRRIAQAIHASGHDVLTFSRRDPKLDFAHDVVQGDFFDRAVRRAAIAFARPDIVIHAAWCVEHGVFWNSPENTLWQEHSINFIHEAKQNGVRRFVGLGTCYEYAWPSDGICDELATPTASHTPYDIAKTRTRQHLAECDEGAVFSTAWARLFFLYGEGEGEMRLGPSVARALLRGDEARCASGTSLRDFLNVRDVGNGIAALALSTVRGAVNIASGAELSIAAFAKRIGEVLGCPEKVVLGALPDRPDEPLRIVAAVRRLHHEVGFMPTISLDAGLRALCEDQRSLVDEQRVMKRALH